MSADTGATSDAGATERGDPRDELLRIASERLFQGRRQIVIRHRGQEYRLQITKGDKLILTK